MPAREETVIVLALSAMVTLLLLALSAWLAVRSRRARSRKPKRRSFEHGRQLGQTGGPPPLDHKLWGDTPVGKLVAQADVREATVIVERPKKVPCTQAAGYVAGAFEARWAHDVLVLHPECAGKEGGACRYVVRWTSGSGPPTAEASTPKSGGALRRSLQARAGAG